MGPSHEGVPEVLGVLAGARVRRVDVPEPDLVALTLSLGRATSTLVLSASDEAPGVGLLDERPKGAPAGSFAQLLRKHLTGATISRVTTPGVGLLVLALERGEERCAIWLSARRRSGGVVLVDEAGKRLGGAPRGPSSVETTPHGAPSPDAWPRDLDELRLAGHALIARRAGAGDRDRHADLRRTLAKGRARVARRVSAIEADLSRAAGAEALRAEATLLLASLQALPAHADHVVLADPESGEERRITLDPALRAAENAERRFVKARKLDRGASIARARLQDAREELARLDAALSLLAAGDEGAARALVEPEARARPGAASPTPARRAPFRTFVLEDGTQILVGRGAKENDVLTFRHAAPDDTFFHARGRTGAHVILRATPGRAMTEAARQAAALLAAHFSAARGDTATDVTTAARRELRRGRAPGSVVMRTSSTLRVRLDDAQLESILSREC